MICRLLPLTFVVLILASCGEPPPAKAPSEKSSAAKPKAKAHSPSALKPASNDPSLTTEQYIEEGMPTTEPPWSAHDLALAVEVVEHVYQDNPKSIPRFGSAKSGEVFSALTDKRMFLRIRQSDLDIATRMKEFSEYLECYGRMRGFYLSIAGTKLDGSRSMFEFLGADLNLTAGGIEVFERSLKALDGKSAEYARVNSTLEQSKKGAVIMIVGALTCLKDDEIGLDAKRSLVTHLAEGVLDIVFRLDNNQRTAIHQALAQVTIRNVDSEMMADIEEMRTAVKRAGIDPSGESTFQSAPPRK